MPTHLASAQVAGVVRASGRVHQWGPPPYKPPYPQVPCDLGPCIQVAAGGDCCNDKFVIAIKTDGSLAGWGYSSYGTTSIPSVGTFTQICAGPYHALAIKADGSVVGWGTNFYGALSIPSDLGPCTKIAAGPLHSAAIKVDGSVVAWGPIEAAPRDLGACSSLAAGGDWGGGFTLVVTADGSVRAWGSNSYGEIDVPSDLGPCVQVAAGDHHSVALKVDGSVATWGLSGSQRFWGQYSQITAGGYQTVALTSGGDIVGLSGSEGWWMNWSWQNPPPWGCMRVAVGGSGWNEGFTVVIADLGNDTDYDGIGDAIDDDDDGDGALDCSDAFPFDPTESLDTDGDGIGNNQDWDDDDDGVPDYSDQCPLDRGYAWVCNGCPPELTPDTDNDGIPDCLDDDDDNDGVADSADAFPLDASESVDTDGDGIGNNADQDDDGDGVVDGVDNCVSTQNPNQTDCNANGIGDACESFVDCNANGIPDSCDLSSGVAQDCNTNGNPDSCDIVGCGSPYPGAVQWTVASGGNGHWYWVSADSMMWAPANAFAHSINGHLATIASAQENSHVRSRIATTTWIGGFQAPKTCEPGCAWEWVTGEPWSYTNWNAGEPNNSWQGQGALVAQDALHMFQNSGLWDDGYDHDSAEPFIVEWEASLPTESDCNSNGVPDSCDIASAFATDCNANGLPDSCDIAGGGRPYPGAVQWTVASGGNGHWYYEVQSIATWPQASEGAVAIGGYLATVTSAAENAFIWSTMPSVPWRWIGGYQDPGTCEPGCDWQWVTAESWSFTNWDIGEPTNAGGNEDHLVMWTDGRWHDLLADYGIHYIVEWPAGVPTESDCNSNGIPDSCDIASGAAGDCNTNAIPDSCEVDSDADGTIDACDGCPNDPAKIAAGVCGCGVADTDTDSDGTANCIDDDDDNDGVADSADAFPLDASESLDTDGDGIGNNADQDDDGDGADDATDGCPLDPAKSSPGQCGCGIADTDSDGDSVADCVDNCVAVSNPTQDDCNGNGIGEACETFTDCNANSIPDSCDIASGFAQDCNGNGKPDSCDISAGNGSPYPGAVQWTVASGGNGHWYWRNPAVVEWSTASSAAIALGADLASITSQLENNFIKNMLPPSSAAYIGGIRENSGWRWVTGEQWSFTSWNPGEPNGGSGQILWIESTGGWNDHVTSNSIQPSIYEWSTGLPTESDCNSNGVPDSCEIASGAASDCNTNAIPDSCEVDSDADGTIDACDGCPNDPAKIAAGVCGCGVADTDTDSDGIANCIDDDDDNDGVADSADAFPLDASESVDTDGDGIGNNADQDDDGDGADDATDGCPLDPTKAAPGQCGCGNPDTDSDGDGVANCVDNCVEVANPTQADCNGNGIGEACESFTDCNANSIPDSCDIASGFAQDCNANGKPDSCDIAAGNGSPYPGAVQWTVASGGNGHWYKGIRASSLQDYVSARDAAMLIGGRLVSLGNAAESAWVFAQVTSDLTLWHINASDGNPYSIGPWIGAHSDPGWVWDDGTPWGFTAWYPGEPNGANPNYILYFGGYTPQGPVTPKALWGDIWNTAATYSYIIEWSTGLPTESDCNSNGVPDSCEIASGSAGDCDNDGILNSCEIAAGALDCNGNGIPDACDVLSGGASVDCNANGIPDSCDIASGASMDCNSNAIPDSCDIATGASRDVDSNGVPDECKPDCNNNDLPDAWEIAQGLVPDCNNNGIPDSCENDSRAANTGNMGRFGNGVPATGTLSAVVATTTAVTVRIEAVGDLGAATEYATLKLGQTVVGTLLFQTTGHDCPANPDVATLTLTKAQWNAIVASAGSSGNVTVTLTGSPLVDAAQCGEAGMSHVSVTYGGPAYDCDGNGLSDLCEVGSGTGDCNNNSILDACELLSGSAPDIDANGVIDSCQTDCNGNSLPDTYEVAQGLVPDCNGNGIPDSCDLAGGAPDCNANGIIDSCDIASGSAPDCNGNGKPDSCDISSGFAADCNANSIPDSCDISSGTVPDCNNNGVPDSCDVASGAPDCNNNGVPDSCDVASGSSNDVDTNGVPDECKTDCNANGLPDAWEILQHLVPDCNGNSVPDSCDVADGTAKDCNENGIPDSCDIAAGEVDKNSDGQPDDCQYRYGDFDLDGNIGGSDLAVLLALWGTIDPVVGDITSDGRVDGQDLAQILARWGPVP